MTASSSAWGRSPDRERRAREPSGVRARRPSAQAGGGRASVPRTFLRSETFELGLYELAAGSEDGQKPHDEDEIYVVMSGRGRFVVDGDDVPVRTPAPCSSWRSTPCTAFTRSRRNSRSSWRSRRRGSAEHGLGRRPEARSELLPGGHRDHARLRADPGAARTLDRVSAAIDTTVKEAVPLFGKAGEALDQVSGQLATADRITKLAADAMDAAERTAHAVAAGVAKPSTVAADAVSSVDRAMRRVPAPPRKYVAEPRSRAGCRHAVMRNRTRIAVVALRSRPCSSRAGSPRSSRSRCLRGSGLQGPAHLRLIVAGAPPYVYDVDHGTVTPFTATGIPAPRWACPLRRRSGGDGRSGARARLVAVPDGGGTHRPTTPAEARAARKASLRFAVARGPGERLTFVDRTTWKRRVLPWRSILGYLDGALVQPHGPDVAIGFADPAYPGPQQAEDVFLLDRRQRIAGARAGAFPHDPAQALEHGLGRRRPPRAARAPTRTAHGSASTVPAIARWPSVASSFPR